jgi:hypothetical protein
MHFITHSLRKLTNDLPFLLAVLGSHYRTDAIDTTFGVRERAILFQE